MKPNLCETCLLKAICSNPCQEFHNERDMLDIHMSKLNKYIMTKKNRVRKHMKQQQLKHYTALLEKWSKNINQMDQIQRRRYIKTGEATFIWREHTEEHFQTRLEINKGVI